MTKKEFKDRCSFHVYGKGQNKRNAIYFDWKTGQTTDNKFFGGFKYMVKTNVQNLSKPELFNVLYNWIVNEIIPDWYVEYKYADSDTNRFRVSLMG